MRIQLDPDPGQTFKSQKLNFYIKNIPKVGNRYKTYIQRYKNLFERQNTRFVCKTWSISVLLDPDPYFHYGSGSKDSHMNVDPGGSGSRSTTLIFNHF
jgi:hypothetical protein